MATTVHDLGTVLISTVQARNSSPGGKKPSAILTALVIDVNRRVSTETLLYAAWGETVPTSTGTLESHVWRLRKILEPERGQGQPPAVLINDTGGYRLLLGPDELDSAIFTRLADDARDLLIAGRPAKALDRVEAAGLLWRGTPYSPMSDLDWVAPSVARLTEIGQQLAERRIEILLALGRADDALAELQPLLAASPYREGLWAHRMLALYRLGRTDDALAAFHLARRTLLDEVGVEPGADLAGLQKRILDADPALRLRETVGPPTPRADQVEVHLPARTTPLIGRDDELAGLPPLVAARRLVSIVGPAGCGKTRLSTDVAHLSSAEFADGVWFVDLSQIDDASQVTDLVMTTVGLSTAAAQAPDAAVHAFLRDQRALLVLDNCEHLPGLRDLVASWLDGPGDAALLATSREPLGLDGEVLWSLAPLTVDADADGSAPAVELFLSRLHDAQPSYTPTAADIATVASICAALDGLPLAIELAAARSRVYSLAEIADQVAVDPGSLSRIGVRAGGRLSVHSTIDSSYQLLSPAEQQTHRELSVLPGPFTVAAATALVGPDAVDVLPMLVNRSMLATSRAHDGRTTFRQLVTVRAHGQRALAETDEAPGALERRDRWALGLAGQYGRIGLSDSLPWYAAVDDDYPTVRAAMQRGLVERFDPSAVRFCSGLVLYWYYRDQLVEGSRVIEQAVRHLDELTATDAVLLLLARSAVQTFQQRPDLGRLNLDDALDRLDRVPPDVRPLVGDNLVLVSACAGLVDADFAVYAVERAAQIAIDTGDPQLDLLVRAQAARTSLPTLGAADPAATAAEAERVYTEAVDAGHLVAAWICCTTRALVAAQQRDPSVGLFWSERLLSTYRQFGSRRGGPIVELHAVFTAMTGNSARAVSLFSASQISAKRSASPWPRLPVSAQIVERCRTALSPEDFDAAWRAGEAFDLDAILTE